MNETENKYSVPNDGCNYYTPEEYASFGDLFAPNDFDSSYIKRKALNIPYGILPEQKLDVYYPDEGEGPWPVIIYVHGGGWMQGTKTLGALDCIIGALNFGYAVISVDYRLAPQVTFPEFIFDVKTAVRWARAHAGEYAFDPEHFGMIGDSAGGHITLMVGFTANRPEYEGEQYGWAGCSSAVQAICDMYGPTDLSVDQAVWYRESGVKRFPFLSDDNAYAPMFGTAHKGFLKLTSPISLVSESIPPTMIQQGYIDGIVAYQNSELLAKKITEVCGADRVNYKLYKERNHSDKAFLTKENNIEVLEFFNKYLK